MTFKPYKTESAGGKLSKLSPTELDFVIEKYGDNPEWLKIKGYRESKATGNSELILNLKGKDYWFPITRKVYESFVKKVKKESRGEGLTFLQSYIRESRGYKGSWPDRNYIQSNKVKGGFFGESSIQPGQVGISSALIDSILRMNQKGANSKQIASELHLSVPQVESVINLDSLLDTKLLIDPKNKAFLNGEGPYQEMGAEVNRSRAQSVKAFKATKADSSSSTPLRLNNMKTRGSRLTVKRSML